MDVIKGEDDLEPFVTGGSVGDVPAPVAEDLKLEEGEIAENEEDLAARVAEPFRVDVSLIPQATLQDAQAVEDLGLQVFNQEELEAGVLAQAERRMEEEAAVRRQNNDNARNARSKLPVKLPSKPTKPTSTSAATKEKANKSNAAHHSAFERYMADQRERMTQKKDSAQSAVTGIRAAALGNGTKRTSSVTKTAGRSKRPRTEEEMILLDDEESDGSASSSKKAQPRGRLKGGKISVDDGHEKAYLARMRTYREAELERKQQAAEAGEEETEYLELSEGLRVPMRVWGELYAYQKRGVKWLWQLHQQQVGGILGDEMGLGKTIQIIAFLAALQYSNIYDKHFAVNGLGAVLIVCPATVLQQWVAEFHKWWPPARVAILHSSGSHSGSKTGLISSMVKVDGILLTSYQGVLSYQDALLKYRWHYVILDEGHKIRNPDSQIAVACKQFRTPHRIVCSGSPMQNNLRELWSLFDFVFPGKLGLLNVFLEQLSVPIVQGSRESASDLQVQTAFVCATTLKDTISPYLLRRNKADVKQTIQLPAKNEQVLFCQLTDHQRKVYEEYLKSDQLKKVIHGDLQIFVGLMQLRKLCNHPDLFDGGPKVFLDVRTQKPILEPDGSSQFGFWRRSGKLIVLEALLKIWKKQKHKVLLFSQSRKMLDILEEFMQERFYKYLRMDGETAIGRRQTLINQFNSDPEIFMFLLTTKVGGLGVNLTGADRVVIFDPDWNPSTDTQARERAWRIGQTREVTIYRLVCAGTIEEKMYHRQIFKQYLTNRVLKDPKQKRFFKHNDLYELFSLAPPEADQQTETGASFFGEEQEKAAKKVAEESKELGEKERLRMLAKKISANIGQGQSNLDLVKSAAAPSGSGRTKKSRAKNMVDGEYVQGLTKKQRYDKGGEDEETEPSSNKKSDAYVLGKLFKKTTGKLHSSIPFEEVAQGDQGDHAIVEAEAQKVAEEAMRMLRLSRKKCHAAQTGIPNWVGGAAFTPVAPAPEMVRSATSKQSLVDQEEDSDEPATASQLLNNLRRSAVSQLNPSSPAPSESSSDGESSSNQFGPTEFAHFENLLTQDGEEETFLSPQQLSLAEELAAFLNHDTLVPGEATTADILKRFKDKLAPTDAALFRAVLRGVCEFRKKRVGPASWVLKTEYRTYSR